MSQAVFFTSKDMAPFDPLAPGFAFSANYQFAEMRKKMPVFRHGSKEWPFISVFRYSDIKKALGEPTVWSSDIPAVAELVLGDASILIQDDPPVHTRLRSLLLPIIAGSSLEHHQAHIAALADKLFTQYSGTEIDFSEQIAAQLAIEVICHLLGIPASEHHYLRDWTNRFSANVGLEFLETNEQRLNDQRIRVSALHKELTNYLADLRVSILATRGDRLVHSLSRTDLTVAEQIGVLKSLLFAGNHSSTILQTNAVWLLATHPEQRRLLATDHSLLDSALDEVLRYKGTFRGITRLAIKDGNIGDVSFHKGEYMIAWLTSANWDNHVFTNPDTFDITRFPNRHIAFGHGPHHCIGANLAKMELRTIVQLLTRLHEIQVLTDPTPIPDPWVDGFQNLQVILRH